MSKDKKDKGRARVSFRAMIIAMVVALLGFLGFGGLELGNGDGADVDTGNKSGIVSETQETQETNKDIEMEEADETIFTIQVREDKIFVTLEGSDDEMEAVSLTFIEETLAGLDSDVRVVVYDDGAINKTYEEVIDLVDKSGLRKSEEKTNE